MTDTDGAIRLGEARYRAGTWAEAAAILARIEQDPKHSPALRLLGLCRLRLSEPAGALALLERAYALAPADPFVQLHLGLGLHALPLNTIRLMEMPRTAPGAAQRALLGSRLAMLVDRARRGASAGSGLRCEPRASSRTLLSSSSSAFASLRSGVSKPSVNQP
jgi:tetratricopeptide (TPR) repeat protein